MAGVDDVIHVTYPRRPRGIQSKVGKQTAKWSTGGQSCGVVVAANVHVQSRRCRNVTTLWGLAFVPRV